MDSSWAQRYIHAGCLWISQPGEDSPHGQPLPSKHQNWVLLAQDGDAENTSQPGLLGHSALKPFISLHRANRIRLEHKHSTVRVYILPQDEGSDSVNRHDVKLNRAMAALLACLDYSTWGEETSLSRECADDASTVSLLDHFNDVPSPNPRPEALTNPENRELMEEILSERIHGVKTELYPYQRRSVAQMLQRELEPGRMLDPRLTHHVDHRGMPWYSDSVTGLVLREPRYYDGVRGGILCEDMGLGKTLMCLALICATRDEPSKAREPFTVEIPTRRRVASLADMAAAAVNRHSYPWRQWKAYLENHPVVEKRRIFPPECIELLDKGENLALYEVPNLKNTESRRSGRAAFWASAPREIHLSSTTLVIVPKNLIIQWQLEIKKHTPCLRVLTIADSKDEIPPVKILMQYDILLFSTNRFEKIERERCVPVGPPRIKQCPLEYMRFKRCIVDEGHKVGNARTPWKTDLTRELGNLEIESRWVVTGTPSRGLYSAEKQKTATLPGSKKKTTGGPNIKMRAQEREDLVRIGTIASGFLRVRPWANAKDELGDMPANWNVYIMQPQHSAKARGRADYLAATMASLMIRHRLSDVGTLLPPVDEKIVVLEGSYQDKLSLNLFSMFIIFNSVQSQRADRDYFFHPSQRRALLQLVSNLKQASFFGGAFFPREDIKRAVIMAKEFLREKKTEISPDDYALMKEAVAFGEIASDNRLKNVSSSFHSLPLFLEHFPGGSSNAQAWSLYGDGDDNDCHIDSNDNAANGPDDADAVDSNEKENQAEDEAVCTEAGLVLELQKFINPAIDAPTSLQKMIGNGSMRRQGLVAKQKALKAAQEAGADATLISGVLVGNDHHTLPTTSLPPATVYGLPDEEPVQDYGNIEIAGALTRTRIISTVSAKLSYLINAVVMHQKEEQMIIFYDNDNVAYYLAGVLEILQVKHLIYSRVGLTAERRAQYVASFTQNPKFRVLLMDISQAAFGLDMRTASRIYFMSPVLNPQVQAQAIGRARRISQQKPVTVETLVLKDSIEEVMIERRHTLSQEEHHKIKSILDDQLLYDWIRNTRIIPMPSVAAGTTSAVAETARLDVPQYVFGRGFGRDQHPDEDLVMGSPAKEAQSQPDFRTRGSKRARVAAPGEEFPTPGTSSGETEPSRPAKKTRSSLGSTSLRKRKENTLEM